MSEEIDAIHKHFQSIAELIAVYKAKAADALLEAQHAQSKTQKVREDLAHEEEQLMNKRRQIHIANDKLDKENRDLIKENERITDENSALVAKKGELTAENFKLENANRDFKKWQKEAEIKLQLKDEELVNREKVISEKEATNPRTKTFLPS